MMTRVGFVGAGYIAQWHAEALAAAGARLVAVCDPAREESGPADRAWNRRVSFVVEAYTEAGR